MGGPFIMAKQKKPVHRVQMTESLHNGSEDHLSGTR